MGNFAKLIDDLALVQRVRGAAPEVVDRLAALDEDAPPDRVREALGAPGRALARGALPATQTTSTAAAVQHSAAESAREMDRLGKALDETLARMPVLQPSREQRIANARQVATSVLAKAMDGFAAGVISAEQVNHLETLAGNAVRAHVDAAQ